MTSTKKIHLEKCLRAFGRTSEKVLQEVESMVFSYNTPPPFETEIMVPSLDQIHGSVKEICDKATASTRKGMMCNAFFAVEIIDNAVVVTHRRNTNPDRVFLKITVKE